MSNVETRQVERDSLLLIAQVRVEGGETEYRVKVRNLSAGGMMAEGEAPVSRGSRVSVELRHIGWVDASVAWTQGERFGIAFVDDIDPKLARTPLSAGAPTHVVPRFSRPAIHAPNRPVRLRNI